MKQIFIGDIQQMETDQMRKKTVRIPHIVQAIIFALLILIPLCAKNIFKSTIGLSPVAKVTTIGGTGSAILLQGNYLLTAAHVVEGMGTNEICEIEFQNPNEPNSFILAEAELLSMGNYSAKPNNIDEDYALLHIKSMDATKYVTPISFANVSNAKVGDVVKVEGFPAGVYALTEGTINNVSGGILNNKNIFVVSAKAWHGNSGGALLNANGQLLGIVTNIGALQGFNDEQTLVLKVDHVKNELIKKGFQL